MDDIMNVTELTTEDPTLFTSDYHYGDYQDYEGVCDRASVRDFRRWFEPPLFWVITLVGGAGNLLVVWIYLNVRRRLKTMSDVFLLNLAVADLLFVVTLPLWAAEASRGWNVGVALCKINSAIYKVNLFSSTLLLTCISVDRYVVIVQTTKAQNSQLERRRCGRLVCAGVWLLALLLATPDLVFGQTVKVEDQLHCRMVFPSQQGKLTKVLLLSLLASIGFFLPFAIMAFCYSVILAKLVRTRNFQKHKAMRVILVVVLVFVLSQLPFNAVLVLEAAHAYNMTAPDCDGQKRLDTLRQVLQSLAYTHACLNPFLYAFVGVRFRRDVLQLLRSCAGRAPTLAKGQSSQSQTARSPLNSARASVLSDSDTSQVLSL